MMESYVHNINPNKSPNINSLALQVTV